MAVATGPMQGSIHAAAALGRSMAPRTSVFPPDLFAFLADLSKNNNREWFKANQDRFEESVREPCLDFIRMVGPRLRDISEHVMAEPKKVGGSLMRIQRDTRFSKDKTPYKDWLAMRFHTKADDTGAGIGFYLALTAEGASAAGGIHEPETATLNKVRDAIVADRKRWHGVLKKVDLNRDAAQLKGAPRGYAKDDPDVEDLRLKSFYAVTPFTAKEVLSAGFPDRFVKECASMAPLQEFLADAIGLPW